MPTTNSSRRRTRPSSRSRTMGAHRVRVVEAHGQHADDGLRVRPTPSGQSDDSMRLRCPRWPWPSKSTFERRPGHGEAPRWRAGQRTVLLARRQVAWVLARADGTLRKIALSGRCADQDQRRGERHRRRHRGVPTTLSCSRGSICFAFLRPAASPTAAVEGRRGSAASASSGIRRSFRPGKAILFTVGMADSYSYDDADIGVLSLDTGKKKILDSGRHQPALFAVRPLDLRASRNASGRAV